MTQTNYRPHQTTLERLVITFIDRKRTRSIGLAGQGFALLGALAGHFTFATGIGPRTVPDKIYITVMITVLAEGLIVTARAPYFADRRPG
jgi:hypothetical protein